MTSEADRMTAYWTWWRRAWHSFIGHELTLSGDNYPSPVCWTCESKRLHGSSEEGKTAKRVVPAPVCNHDPEHNPVTGRTYCEKCGITF